MKTIQGTVVALKTPQTARVEVTRRWQHPLYKKFVTRSKNYLCQVDELELHEGDEVVIQECAPISKNKHFVVVAKVEAN
jgi:small subunit ribosomal protein S17